MRVRDGRSVPPCLVCSAASSLSPSLSPQSSLSSRGILFVRPEAARDRSHRGRSGFTAASQQRKGTATVSDRDSLSMNAAGAFGASGPPLSALPSFLSFPLTAFKFASRVCPYSRSMLLSVSSTNLASRQGHRAHTVSRWLLRCACSPLVCRAELPSPAAMQLCVCSTDLDAPLASERMSCGQSRSHPRTRMCASYESRLMRTGSNEARGAAMTREGAAERERETRLLNSGILSGSSPLRSSCVDVARVPRCLLLLSVCCPLHLFPSSSSPAPPSTPRCCVSLPHCALRCACCAPQKGSPPRGIRTAAHQSREAKEESTHTGADEGGGNNVGLRRD